ncbi:MAG: hypothetical protein SGILL_004696, partial [Bacillariaceae sp.]
MAVLGLAFAVGSSGGTASLQHYAHAHDDGNTHSNSDSLHHKSRDISSFHQHHQDPSAYSLTGQESSKPTTRSGPPASAVDKAPPTTTTVAAATIHTNKHGLIAVTVSVEQEQIQCLKNSSRNSSTPLSPSPNFLWTVAVEEAPVFTKKSPTSTSKAVSAELQPVLRLSKNLSLHWNRRETVPSLWNSSVAANSATDEDFVSSLLSFSGSASCSFVIPLESYPGEDAAEDLPLASLMHTTAAARTFIVSLWMIPTNVQAEIKGESKEHQPQRQQQLVMRRLATLPRMANPRQTIDPVAKVVLEHTLPM